MDASGEVQTDVASTLFKTRLDTDGRPIEVAKLDVGYNYEPPPEDYCGPCYGGKSPHEDGCCNSCQDVRDAYQANGWAISDYNAMEQCAREQYPSPFFSAVVDREVTRRICRVKVMRDVTLRDIFESIKYLETSILHLEGVLRSMECMSMTRYALSNCGLLTIADRVFQSRRWFGKT